MNDCEEHYKLLEFHFSYFFFANNKTFSRENEKPGFSASLFTEIFPEPPKRAKPLMLT
jgi:hypothetical protein